MRILMVHNHWLEKGGEDAVVSSEIDLLLSKGQEVVFFEKHNKEINQYSFVKKISFFTKDMVWSRSAYQETKKIIKEKKPDIAHVHNTFLIITPSIYYALSEFNIPVVQTLHNYRIFCPNGVLYRNRRVCLKCPEKGLRYAVFYKCWRNSYLLSYLFARALKIYAQRGIFREKINCYIALSDFSRENFIKWGLPGNKIFVKPNFFDGVVIKNRELSHNFAIFIGRLADYKGVKILISVFKRYAKGVLKVVGDGPLYKVLNSLTAGDENISILGRLSRAKTLGLLKTSKFLVVPSECYENMPRVILEAFACGVPVVASRLGAMQEMIEDRKTGVLFEPNNPEDMFEKIKWCWEHPNTLKYIGRNAQKELVDKYSRDMNYNKLINIYNKAIDLAK